MSIIKGIFVRIWMWGVMASVAVEEMETCVMALIANTYEMMMMPVMGSNGIEERAYVMCGDKCSY